MQTQSKLFDDFARLLTNAAGAAKGVRDEIDNLVRQQMERFLADMDLVTRDEFEAVREMAVKAREENDRLAAELRDLQNKLPKKRATAKKKPPVKQ